ncbi:MAG: hypothetical protein ACRD9Y_06115, partial [Blastocatellia bacterium]
MNRLARALNFAEGFWLGFVVCNSDEERRAIVAKCRGSLDPGIRIVEIEIDEPPTLEKPLNLLNVIQERLAREGEMASTGCRKLVFFVYGLQGWLPSSERYSPLLSSLNSNRELFRQEFPHPLAVWLPDYALTMLARGAPD